MCLGRNPATGFLFQCHSLKGLSHENPRSTAPAASAASARVRGAGPLGNPDVNVEKYRVPPKSIAIARRDGPRGFGRRKACPCRPLRDDSKLEGCLPRYESALVMPGRRLSLSRPCAWPARPRVPPVTDECLGSIVGPLTAQSRNLRQPTATVGLVVTAEGRCLMIRRSWQGQRCCNAPSER